MDFFRQGTTFQQYLKRTVADKAWPVFPAEPSQRRRAALAAAFLSEAAPGQGLIQYRIFDAVLIVQRILRLVAIHLPLIGSFSTLCTADDFFLYSLYPSEFL